MKSFKEIYDVDSRTMNMIISHLKTASIEKYIGGYAYRWKLEGINKDIDYQSYSFKYDDYYTFDVDVWEKELKVRIYVYINIDGEDRYSSDKIASIVKNYFFNK